MICLQDGLALYYACMICLHDIIIIRHFVSLACVICLQVGLSMYFLMKGTVEAVVGDGEEEKQVKFVNDGGYFGEIALLMPIRRPVGVRALTHCHVSAASSLAVTDHTCLLIGCF